MNRSRFAAHFPPDVIGNTRVTIVGLGNLGSHIALLLGKVGHPLTLIDKDVVGEENYATQAYDHGYLGMEKPEAMAAIIRDYDCPDGDFITHCSPFAAAMISDDTRIVISALDNIPARRKVWDATHVGQLVIDPRMAFLHYEIFTNVKSNMGCAYETALMDKTQKYKRERCGARSYPGTGMYVAAIVHALISRWLFPEEGPLPTYISGVAGWEQTNTYPRLRPDEDAS